ncbi:low molecular weight phosphatase family protein [Curtobacterium sp. L1-20]|uniref:arsenate reductase/protein-tyrosine-phosphatase family protein n=1 Tax=Curtobacterium sp. L1-20 TaxID=3138181 RepID=UPI003B528C07
MTARRILFVCEGNICRSPYAAAAFSERWETLAGARPTVVSSAGTRAVVGAPAHELLAGHLQEPSLLDAHVARQLTAAIVRGQDLVLTMERAQRGAVLDLVPAALRRTFTLPEVQRLAEPVLDGWNADTLRGADSLHELLGRQRASGAGSTSADDDVADPVLGGAAEFAAMTARIDRAVDELVALLIRFDSSMAGARR